MCIKSWVVYTHFCVMNWRRRIIRLWECARQNVGRKCLSSGIYYWISSIVKFFTQMLRNRIRLAEKRWVFLIHLWTIDRMDFFLRITLLIVSIQNSIWRSVLLLAIFINLCFRLLSLRVWKHVLLNWFCSWKVDTLKTFNEINEKWSVVYVCDCDLSKLS